MTSESWIVKSKHHEWYYYRLQITTKNEPDSMTWKLAILKCLQQMHGIFGKAIEFDLMLNSEIKGHETVVRVHFQDRLQFAECVAAGVFEDDKNGDAGLRILAQSASLQGVITDRLNWDM